MDDDPLAPLVIRAQDGDRAALEDLVRAVQDDLYGLAVRYLGHPDDADDAVQEILTRVVVHLGSFRGDSRFSTWAYRVGVNHLLNTRRRLARPETPFDVARNRLEAAVEASRDAVATDDALVAQELKLACAHGMLLCLDPEHRIAYVLGVLLELPGDTAAAVAGITPATFRKRLQRARTRMRQYFNPVCGLVDEAHPCRCAKMAGPAAAAGVVEPGRLAYVHRIDTVDRLRDATERLQETTEVLRRYPRYRAPQDFAAGVSELLRRIPELHQSQHDGSHGE